MFALTSTTGKLGSATLNSILAHNLIPPTNLAIFTSSPLSSPHFTPYKNLGITIRSFNFDSPDPQAFLGCSKLFLVSTPNISLDFGEREKGGREGVHIAAINAALNAGVKEVVYTSLAFGGESEAGVMRAHLRTEEFLKGLKEKGQVEYTIIREGLYNESWPLYLGYFDLKGDERGEVVLAGDGKISWTSIADLGLGTALVLADGSGKFKGKTFYLSNSKEARSLKEIAELVGKIKGKDVKVKIVDREDFVNRYVGRGKEKQAVEWWSSTYGALTKGECRIEDATLNELLESRDVVPKSMEETVREMLA